ncbi:hypothetical protein ACOJR9_05860 [Alteromonas sp. A081]|uniref:hypothetical protein n=1 Tax=Alteromonas sp. A081 TaxID=3410269 RepID=UPI003B97DBB3
MQAIKKASLFYSVKLLSFFLGLYGCFVLHELLEVPSVVSAASIGLIGSFLPTTTQFQHHPQAAMYAGAFAGMCSSHVISSTYELVFISLVGATLYTTLKNHFIGIGGKLGTIAFVSVASVVIVKLVIG